MATPRIVLVLLVAYLACASAAENALQPPYSWRGIDGSGVFPAGDLVTEFWDVHEAVPIDDEAYTKKHKLHGLPAAAKPGSRTNIVWRVELPSWGHNSPVVMGDRVYLLVEPDSAANAPMLLCYSADDGKPLWKRPVDHLDAWPAKKQAEAKEIRRVEIERWEGYMRWWNRFYWDNEKDERKEIDEATHEKLRAEAKEDGYLWPDYEADAGRRQFKGLWRRCRYGVYDGRRRVGPGDPAVAEAFERSGKERIYWREGWTSEGPWYGVTFGSVVGDGKRIYAVTAMGGAAAYDADGKRLWVTDLGVEPLSWLGPHMKWFNMQLASPVLVGDTLVYWHSDMKTMYGLDAGTGKLRWQTEAPKIPGDPKAKDKKKRKDRYVGYSGHMGPNGTPVVLDLGGTPVAVTSHGWVVRVADGKGLGQVEFSRETASAHKKLAKKYPNGHASTYGSWVGAGDVLYAQFNGIDLQAFRLGVDGDELTQELLWRNGGFKVDGRGANLVLHDGLLSGGTVEKRKTSGGRHFGIIPLKQQDGSIAVEDRFRIGGYQTIVGHWPGGLVVRTSGWGAGDSFRGGPDIGRFLIAATPTMKQLGQGLLAPGPLSEEQRQRHIALVGFPGWRWGTGGAVPWGNRIFIRSNDYLWCVGDPGAEWKPPEAYLP